MPDYRSCRSAKKGLRHLSAQKAGNLAYIRGSKLSTYATGPALPRPEESATKLIIRHGIQTVPQYSLDGKKIVLRNLIVPAHMKSGCAEGYGKQLLFGSVFLMARNR